MLFEYKWRDFDALVRLAVEEHFVAALHISRDPPSPLEGEVSVEFERVNYLSHRGFGAWRNRWVILSPEQRQS